MACDPACVKIIINSGFMAPLARLLADEHDGLSDAADRLAHVAESVRDVYQHAIRTGVIVLSGKPSFSGCEQATQLLAWIDADEVVVAGAEATMQEWADDMLEAVETLVRGG